MIDDGVQVLELKGQKIRLRANDQVTGALVFAGGALPNIRDIEELRADLSYSLPSGERVSKNVVLRSVREMPYDESIMGIVTCSEERKTAGPILGPKGGKHKGRERRPARGRADAPASSNIPVSTAKSTPSPASRLGPTNVAVNRITGKRIPVGTDLRLSDFGDDNHLWAELQLPWQEEPTDLGLVPILDGAVILPLPFVFLCHAKEDRDAVRGISDNLLMMRIITWMDEKDLLPGDRWKVEIDRAIEECDFFVVALSRSSCTKTGYVQREIKYAIEQMELRSPRSRFIVPVLLEPCEPPRDFGDLHWLRLWEPGSMEKLVASLSDPSALDSYGRTDWTIAGATDINAMSATFRITNKGAASVVRPTEYGWRGIQSSPTALELAESPREVKPTSSTRHTRIVHISDLHLDPAIDFSADLQPLVNDLEEFAPHAILISGDITDRPSNDSLRMAESYVCRLKSFCEVVVLVPGNHDVDLPNRGFTLPFPHNRGTASFKEVFDFRPVQYFEALQLAVFSLDSNSSDTMRSAGGGIIGSQQLRDLSDNWDELALEHGDQFATSVKIVLLHHHPLPIAQPGSLVGDREQALHDAGKLRRILDEKRIDLVLHGHRHGAHFLSTTNPAVDPAHLVTIIGAGSALATGNSLIMESSYNRLTLMPTGKIVLDRRKRELAGFITADTCTWDRAGRNP
jgi:predicted MPP superfamily phosphohydrolase